MNPDHMKTAVDGAALGVTLGTVAQWLPAVAAIFSIVWTVIRIWETQTIQNFIKKRTTKCSDS